MASLNVERVAPWLSATVWNTSKTTSFVSEILPFAAVLDPVVREGFLRVRYLAAREVGEPVVDPLLEVSEVLSDLHIVLVDDFLGGIAIGKHGVEAFPDLPDPVRDRIAFDAEMQVPVEIEIALKIGP